MSPLRDFALVLLSVVAGGCGVQGLAPIPRFHSEPQWMCQGEATDVRLDATSSLGFDGRPDATLAFAWSFYSAPLDLIAGGLDEARVTGHFDGILPVRVHLIVSDTRGFVADRDDVIGLTIAEPIACGDGCTGARLCATFAGTDTCVDDLVCQDDDACGPCLVCRDDDDGVSRCVGVHAASR